MISGKRRGLVVVGSFAVACVFAFAPQSVFATHDHFDDEGESTAVSVLHEPGMTILRWGGVTTGDDVCYPNPEQHGCIACDPDPNVCVPDISCVTVEIPVSGAPPDARVSMMHLHLKIQGETGACGDDPLWPGDMVVIIFDAQHCRGDLVLWDRDGGARDGNMDDDEENDSDIEFDRSVSHFNGCEVNQTWSLLVCDENTDDEGEIDYFEIWLCYEGEAACRRDPEWVCDGDVDGDGQVNPVDRGIVQVNFGNADEQALCNYDVDCDGQINPVDAGIVQSLFGTCDVPRDACP